MQPAVSKTLHRLSPVRPWFSDISRDTLKADIIAGCTNAAIVLPQGVAFAIIAGLPPEYGLFTAIVVCAIAAFWGASKVMVSDPTTAISAVVFATLVEMTTPGSTDYIALALTLTFMVGVLQLISGLVGLGGLIAFVSHSIIVGFTAAAAFLIAASQLSGALGIETGGGGGVMERLERVFHQINETNIAAVLVSAATFATIIIVTRVDKRIPAYIIALFVGGLVAFLCGGEDAGLRMFAPLTSVLPGFTTPQFSPAVIGDLLPGAVVVAFVGLLEAISIGKSFALRRAERYDSNQEIVGQGLSNIAGSFLQSYAGSGSFTRSGLNAESGALTPMAAFFAALVLGLAPWVMQIVSSVFPVAAMMSARRVAFGRVSCASIKMALCSPTMMVLSTAAPQRSAVKMSARPMAARTGPARPVAAVAAESAIKFRLSSNCIEFSSRMKTVIGRSGASRFPRAISAFCYRQFE